MHALHRLRINRTRQINLKVIATWSASAAMKTCPAELSSGLFVLLLKTRHSLVPSHIPDKGKRLSVEAAGQGMNAFFTTTFRFKTRHTCIGDHLFDGQTRRPFTQLSLLPVNLDSGGVLLFSVLWSSMGARVVAVRLPRIDNEPAVVW